MRLQGKRLLHNNTSKFHAILTLVVNVSNVWKSIFVLFRGSQRNSNALFFSRFATFCFEKTLLRKIIFLSSLILFAAPLGGLPSKNFCCPMGHISFSRIQIPKHRHLYNVPIIYVSRQPVSIILYIKDYISILAGSICYSTNAGSGCHTI